MTNDFDPHRNIPNQPTQETLSIAIVSESGLGHMSGVTRSVWHVLDYLASNQHPAIAMCPQPTPDEHAGTQIIPTHYMPLRGFNVGLTRPNGRGLLSRLQEADFTPDIIHAASPFGPLGMAAVNASKKLDIPCVAIYQTNMPEYFRQSGAAVFSSQAKRHAARLHNNAALTLVPSTAARDDILEWGVDPERVKPWERGVDAQLFSPRQNELEAVQELRQQIAPDGQPIIGYVGRLAPEKELGRLSVLLPLLQSEAKLVIVGKGPEENSLRAMLGDKAAFLGEKRGQELAEAYALLDIFVHTGTNETFGQTIQEAMAAGLPVVAPRAGGPIDIVRPESGYLFDPNDDQDFAKRVTTLVKDQSLRRQMGECGRQIVLPRSWNALCHKLVETYYRSVL